MQKFKQSVSLSHWVALVPTFCLFSTTPSGDQFMQICRTLL